MSAKRRTKIKAPKASTKTDAPPSTTGGGEVCPRPGYVLVLRTCDANMRGYGGFQWPDSGLAEAPDWTPARSCGRGLHGFLWGEGDGSLASWEPDARWLVVEVEASAVVILDGKVKFPRGYVVHAGDRASATAFIAARAPDRSIVGGTSTSGDGGTSTSGDGGTSISGDGGTSISGDGGTSTSGDGGTSISGAKGELRIQYYDPKAERYRTAVAYVGEDGIEPDTAYILDESSMPPRFVRKS